MSDEYKRLVKELLGSRIVAYYPSLANIVGGVKPAILLSQLLYYDHCQDVPGDWFSVKVETLKKHTGLSVKEQRTARKMLVESGILEVKRKGMPAKYWYRVDLDTLAMVVSNADKDTEQDTQELPDGTLLKGQKVDSRVSQTDTLDSLNGTLIKESFKESSKKLIKKNSDRPPSVELCKRIIYRFPHKSLWKTIHFKVGADFISLLRWGRLLRHWKLQGWNPTNFKGMLDAFSRNDRDNPDSYDSEIARQKYAKQWQERS